MSHTHTHTQRLLSSHSKGVEEERRKTALLSVGDQCCCPKEALVKRTEEMIGEIEMVEVATEQVGDGRGWVVV